MPTDPDSRSSLGIAKLRNLSFYQTNLRQNVPVVDHVSIAAAQSVCNLNLRCASRRNSSIRIPLDTSPGIGGDNFSQGLN